MQRLQRVSFKYSGTLNLHQLIQNVLFRAMNFPQNHNKNPFYRAWQRQHDYVYANDTVRMTRPKLNLAIFPFPFGK